MVQELSCLICLNLVGDDGAHRNPVVYCKGHFYCRRCINEWMRCARRYPPRSLYSSRTHACGFLSAACAGPQGAKRDAVPRAAGRALLRAAARLGRVARAEDDRGADASAGPRLRSQASPPDRPLRACRGILDARACVLRRRTWAAVCDAARRATATCPARCQCSGCWDPTHDVGPRKLRLAAGHGGTPLKRGEPPSPPRLSD
eukprot:1156346-Rhodomonas_salina.2